MIATLFLAVAETFIVTLLSLHRIGSAQAGLVTLRYSARLLLLQAFDRVNL